MKENNGSSVSTISVILFCAIILIVTILFACNAYGTYKNGNKNAVVYSEESKFAENKLKAYKLNNLYYVEISKVNLKAGQKVTGEFRCDKDSKEVLDYTYTSYKTDKLGNEIRVLRRMGFDVKKEACTFYNITDREGQESNNVSSAGKRNQKEYSKEVSGYYKEHKKELDNISSRYYKEIESVVSDEKKIIVKQESSKFTIKELKKDLESLFIENLSSVTFINIINIFMP